uniref:Uncharacterized protein n=1 Tax=viral metagenome TaxID=1070528 RepID=A0A6C0E3F9_9ZZZZ
MQLFQIITIITFTYYVSNYFVNSAKIYLSNSQWKMIHHLLEHKQLTLPMKHKLNTVLFHCYDDWACYKAKEFKKIHNYKCNHIPVDELQMYARVGLIHAIRNYKGKSVFSHYANIYIQGELYKGMTELHPLTCISPRDRKNKTLPSIKKKHVLTTYFLGNNEWMIDKIQSYKNNLDNEILNKCIIKEEFWKTIDKQSNIKTKRMIHYKFDYEWNQLRTNKQVAELMGCSQEHVRKTIKNLCL